MAASEKEMKGKKIDERQRSAAWEEFENLLLDQAEFFLPLIWRFLPKKDLVQNLVSSFVMQKKEMDFFRSFIRKEVEGANNHWTLFRANSPGIRMITHYMRQIGKEYLEETLTELIHQTILLVKESPLEPDPRRSKEPVKNQERLKEIGQHFLDAIYNSLDKIPLQISILLQILTEELEKKFPDLDPSLILGWFFMLRFVAPSLTAPEMWFDSFKKEPLGPEVRRVLLLLAGSIQNISNGVIYSQKESYLMPLNPFISKNHDSMKHFLKKIPNLENDPVFFEWKEEREKTLYHLYEILWEHQEEVNEKFQQETETDESILLVQDRMSHVFSILQDTLSQEVDCDLIQQSRFLSIKKAVRTD